MTRILRFYLAFSIAIGFLAAGAWLVPAVNAEFANFISQRNGKLYDGENELRFVSWNIPNLHNLEDSFDFLSDSSWRWPDEFEITDALESVAQMGGTVVRPYVISVKRTDSDMGDNVHVIAPGEFNEQAFQVLDLVLKIARDKGIRVVIPLVDNWKWWGGIKEYAAFRGKETEAFWTDPQIIDDFKRTVEFVVTRRNTITGVMYKDDPTILGWETGNEIAATPEWTRTISAYLKQLDTRHLVIDGRSFHGISVESLNDPNIDVLTTHHYPGPGKDIVQDIIDASKTINKRKAYFVGEFGFISVEESKRVIDTVIEREISGALYWSLRFHRREGGFYWHYEPLGEDLFKAFHWPGFPAGNAYHENDVIPMIREGAYRIRGMEVPPLPIPKSPILLEIDDPAHISWQGATGASAYDVERAIRPTGPWNRIAGDVSDAAVQYRPLFADAEVESGHSYYYRVIAKNSSGESAPSNVVGPVSVDHLTLVDELQDLSQLHSSSGNYKIRSDDFRKVQEDIHRLELSPGAKVVYQLPGSVESVRLWVFATSPATGLTVKTSSGEGSSLEAIECTQRSVDRSQSDYGYLTPVLIEASTIPESARYIHISLPKSIDNEVQLSRVEIRYGKK